MSRSLLSLVALILVIFSNSPVAFADTVTLDNDAVLRLQERMQVEQDASQRALDLFRENKIRAERQEPAMSFNGKEIVATKIDSYINGGKYFAEIATFRTQTLYKFKSDTHSIFCLVNNQDLKLPDYCNIYFN